MHRSKRSLGLGLGLLAVAVGTACTRPREPERGPSGTGRRPAAAAPPDEASTLPARPTLKLGQIMPYTGPAAAYGNIGRLHAAYFEMVNERGGVAGRQIDLISLDDGYDPVRALAQVRALVERERVVAIFSPVGTPSNVAIQPYLNDVEVPQLFVSTGASRWDDPRHYPFTLGFNPSYRLEGKTYAGHVLAERPGAKIAVLYQDDDFGRDLLAGFREGLGAAAAQIVATERYLTSELRIDPHVEALSKSGADTLVLVTTPRFGIQALRRADALAWKPARYIANVSASIGTVLTQAGLERSEGLVTVQYLKDPNDKRWQNDPGMQAWRAFMRDHYPQGDTRDGLNVYAYVAAETLMHVLTRCGDDFSPKNLMAQAASLRDFAPGLLLPGVKINTSPTDYEPFDTLQLARFDGTSWQLLDQEHAGLSRLPPGRARETARR